MAELVRDYLNKIDDLQVRIIEDADLILEAIDLDDLLANPETYLKALGEAFLNEHLDEIKKGFDEGQQFALKVLKES